jgi:hypothetical protein
LDCSPVSKGVVSSLWTSMSSQIFLLQDRPQLTPFR